MTPPDLAVASNGWPPAPSSEALPASAADAGWRPYPGESDGDGHTVVGNVQILEGLYSPQLDNRRSALVYLPPSYDAGDRRYPVIYMHDGQNLFDEATSFAGEWGVDDTMEAFSRAGLEAIVVGIFNAGEDRLDEYSPFEDAQGRGGNGDRYLDFVVETLKPRVDRDFRTRSGRDDTVIAGSSMGGLISLYAFFRHPDVFGRAGVMSPSLWFADRAVLPFVEAAPFVGGRLYVGVGTDEGEGVVADARRLRDLLCEKGYQRRRDLLFLEQRGAGHTEAAWRRRFRYVVRFLLREGA